MGLIEKELIQYTGLNEDELDGFMIVLKNKGFLEPDNSLQILLKMFEASYSKGRTDLLKELSDAMKGDIKYEEE